MNILGWTKSPLGFFQQDGTEIPKNELFSQPISTFIFFSFPSGKKNLIILLLF